MKKVCLDDRCEIKIDSPEDKLNKEINEMMNPDVEKSFDDGFNEKLNTERLSVRYNKNIPIDTPNMEILEETDDEPIDKEIEYFEINDPSEVQHQSNFESLDDNDTGVTCDDALAVLEETDDVMVEIQCALSENSEECIIKAKKILTDFKNGLIDKNELGEKMKKLVSQ